MRYDLKRIMKRAWILKRRNKKNLFALCLRMSWFEFKQGLKDELVNTMLNTFCTQKRPKYYRDNMSTSAMCRMLERNRIEVPSNIAMLMDR